MYSQGRGEAILKCTEMPTSPSSWFILSTNQLLFASQLEQPSGSLISCFHFLGPAGSLVDDEVASKTWRVPLALCVSVSVFSHGTRWLVVLDYVLMDTQLPLTDSFGK